MNFLCTLEARLNSKRLPKKILKKIGKRSIIEILINRLKLLNKIDHFIVITTNNKLDDTLIDLLKKLKISYVRGSEKNVYARIVKAGKFYNSKNIIRLTSDNLFVDPEMIDEMISSFQKKLPDYMINSYGIDLKKRQLPYGLDVEIFKFKTFLKAKKLVNRDQLKEFPTLFFRENKKKFKIKFFKIKRKWSINNKYRLTLDTIEDFVFIKKLYLLLYKNFGHNFFLKNINDILSENHKILKINSNIKQKND